MCGKIIIAVSAFIMILISSSYSLELTGQRAGELAGDYANQQYKSKNDIEMKVKMPMTDPTTELTTLDGTDHGSAAAFCGQGSVKDQALALEVTLNETSISIGSDTNSDGIIDSVNTGTITSVCTDGVKAGATFMKWKVLPSGYVGTEIVNTLSGCIDPATAPPSYAGGRIAELYAAATGRIIMGSQLKGSKISYYSGQVKDCNNQPQSLTQTKYYNNPYAMEQDGLIQAGTCTGNNTSECGAYQGLVNANNNFSAGSGDVTCAVTRNIPTTTGPYKGKICDPNKVYYATGYSETNKWCQPASRWDYTSLIQLRCNPYGSALSVEGWASWEGAPCGTKANFPPSYQINRDVAYENRDEAIIGNFSVNYRIDGPNTSSNDLSADIRCISDVTPFNVKMAIACPSDKSYCNYSFNIDNAPSCSSFMIRVAPPVDDEINDGCSLYSGNGSSYNCKLKAERWFDANGTWTEIIVSGSPTYNKTEDTCKTVSVGVVCRPWWSQEKTYSCESKQVADPDMSRVSSVTNTAALTGDLITYTSAECSQTGANCKIKALDPALASGEDCEIACLIERAAGAAKKGNSSMDYYAQPCTKMMQGATVSHTCPLEPGDRLIQDCGCINTSGQALGVLGAVYEATRDRQCD